MSFAHRYYASLLSSGGLQPPYWDWNPTEGSGTTITDKQGSGVDLTTNGVWVSSGQVRYDHLGLFNHRHASVANAALTMATSSAFIYVHMPAAWTHGQHLIGHQPSYQGHSGERELTISLSTGKISVFITEAAGPFNNRTVTSTSTFGVDDEFMAGWTHDGTTLRLYINGVEEDSIGCAIAGTPTSPSFHIAGLTPFSDHEPPSTGGLFGSTGAIFGRCVAANRGFDASEVTDLYAQMKAQYPGLP